MSRRRSVGAAKRHVIGGVSPNNAPGLYVWSDQKNWGGDPDNSPPRVGLSYARLDGYATERMVAGGGFIHSGVECDAIRPTGGPRYDTDGTLNMSPLTSGRAWYQQATTTAVRSGWPGGVSWMQRTAQLGLKNFIAFHTVNSSSGTLAWKSWHDHTAWGASTVAGALTPTAGSMLAHLTSLVKTAYNAGFQGVYFDPESTGGANDINYATKPGAQTEAETRAFVVLRGRQVSKVIATHMPVPGGPELGYYLDLSLGSLFELNNYIADNGSPPSTETLYQRTIHDSFTAGLACEPGISGYYQIDHSFYRDSWIYGDSTANDDKVTKYANAYSFNTGRRFARQSQQLAADSSLTAADRLTSLRNTYRCGFLWPGDDVDAGPMTTANWQVMTREAVRWSMGAVKGDGTAGTGRHYFYIRGGTEQFNEVPTGNGSTNATGASDLNKYEAGWQAELVSAVADSVAPVCVITTPSQSTTATSITVTGTAEDNQAIWRVEWANAANSTSGAATTTHVINNPHWIPLSSTELPRRTSHGFLDPSMTWTADIALELGDNLITVTAYDIHGNSHAAAITVTATPVYTYAFTGSSAAPWVGWTAFAGTCDLTGATGKGRTQTSTTAYSSAGEYLNLPLPQNYELTANTTITTVTAAEFYGAINLRAATTVFTDIRQASCWSVLFVGTATTGGALLYKTDAAGTATWTNVGGPDIDFVQGSILRTRIRVDGANIKVRYWKNSETEPPSTWGIDYTDATPPSGTYLSVGNRNGSNTSFDRWDWDDVTVTAITSDPDPPSSSGVHWGYDITQDGYNNPGGFNISAVNAISSVPNAFITSHIGGFGVYPPETSNNVFDWGGEIRGVPANGLDDGVDHVRAFTGATGINAIALCSSPGWMKASGLDFSMDEAPTVGNEQNFADLCGAIAARYTDVLWFPFWNELKGMWNSGLNRWDYEKYTRMYNLARAAMLAVRPDALTGGTWVVSSSWSSGAPAPTLGDPACPFTGGSIDGRALDVFSYFRDNASGWDYITCDIWAGNQFGTTLGSGVTATQQLDKFVQQINWLRTHIEATKPIIITEAYISADGSFSQTQAEDAVLGLFARIRDECDVQQGVYFVTWGEAAEPPNPINYTTGAATGLIQKLIDWEAAQ